MNHPAPAATLSRRTWLKRLGLCACAAAATSPLGANAAPAQDYPARAVRIIVPFAAGGSGDAVTRLVAERLSARLGQQFLVENKVGAGGATGAIAAGKAEPDGYTLGFISAGHAWLAAINPRLPDPLRDLTPVALICSTPYVLLTRPDAPFRTLPELIEHARKHPGQLNLASAGVGTLTHLLPAWLMAETGTKFNHVPYSGTAPAMNALLAGQVDLYTDPVATTLPQVQAGKVRVLATTGAARVNALPQVPTLVEQGYKVSGATWFGIVAPRNTPKALVEKLNREVNAVLDEPDVRARLDRMNFTIESGPVAHFAGFLDAEVRRWTQIVERNGIRGD